MATRLTTLVLLLAAAGCTMHGHPEHRSRPATQEYANCMHYFTVERQCRLAHPDPAAVCNAARRHVLRTGASYGYRHAFPDDCGNRRPAGRRHH